MSKRSRKKKKRKRKEPKTPPEKVVITTENAYDVLRKSFETERKRVAASQKCLNALSKVTQDVSSTLTKLERCWMDPLLDFTVDLTDPDSKLVSFRDLAALTDAMADDREEAETGVAVAPKTKAKGGKRKGKKGKVAQEASASKGRRKELKARRKRAALRDAVLGSSTEQQQAEHRGLLSLQKSLRAVPETLSLFSEGLRHDCAEVLLQPYQKKLEGAMKLLHSRDALKSKFDKLQSAHSRLDHKQSSLAVKEARKSVSSLSGLAPGTAAMSPAMTALMSKVAAARQKMLDARTAYEDTDSEAKRLLLSLLKEKESVAVPYVKKFFSLSEVTLCGVENNLDEIGTAIGEISELLRAQFKSLKRTDVGLGPPGGMKTADVAQVRRQEGEGKGEAEAEEEGEVAAAEKVVTAKGGKKKTPAAAAAAVKEKGEEEGEGEDKEEGEGEEGESEGDEGESSDEGEGEDEEEEEGEEGDEEGEESDEGEEEEEEGEEEEEEEEGE